MMAFVSSDDLNCGEDWDPASECESGSEFSVIGDICVLFDSEYSSPSFTVDVRPSMSEKKPLESISLAKERTIELEDIMDDGILLDMLAMPMS